MARVCRADKLTCHGPPGFIDKVQSRLGGYDWNLTDGNHFELTAREVEFEPENTVLFDDSGTTTGLDNEVFGAVTNITNASFVLGGGLVEALSQIYLEEVKKTIAENILECYAETTKIKLAALGDDAGAMGAAIWGGVRAKV